MDASSLKSIQEPLKARYKAEPESALITLKAVSRIGEGITCRIETGKMLAEAGLHPATGGDGLSVCSGDMLLEALAACAGVTLKAVATATGFELQDASVHVEGDLDFRGTLSVDKNAPVGFKDIRLRTVLCRLPNSRPGQPDPCIHCPAKLRNPLRSRALKYRINISICYKQNCHAFIHGFSQDSPHHH